MTSLARVVLDALREDPDAVRELRDMLDVPDGGADTWLSAAEAAQFLGLTVNALHKLTARRSLPFAQDAPGGKLYFRRCDLTSWREERVREAR